jgi:predicted Zn-dependent peptidase
MIAAANANIKQKKKSDLEKQSKETIDVAKEMDDVVDTYNKLTKADIARVAQQYLKKENRLVLYYLPKKEN